MSTDSRKFSLKWRAASVAALMYFLPLAALLLWAVHLQSAGDPDAAAGLGGVGLLFLPFTAWLSTGIELLSDPISWKMQDAWVLGIGSILYFFLGFLWGRCASSINIKPQKNLTSAFHWIGFLTLSLLFVRVLCADLIGAFFIIV